MSHTPDVANNVLKLARVKTMPAELVFPHLDWVYVIGFNEYILSTLGTEPTLQCYVLPSQTVAFPLVFTPFCYRTHVGLCLLNGNFCLFS